MQPVEIYVDDEAKLTLHGLVQHYIMLNEEEKNRKLNDLLDALDFNQVRSNCCAVDIAMPSISFPHDGATQQYRQMSVSTAACSRALTLAGIILCRS